MGNTEHREERRWSSRFSRLSVDFAEVDGAVFASWGMEVPLWDPEQKDLAGTLVPFGPTASVERQFGELCVGDFRPALDMVSDILGGLEHVLRLGGELTRRLAILHDHGWVY